MRPSISLRTNGAPTAPATPSLSNGPRPFEWFESLTTNGLPGPVRPSISLRTNGAPTAPATLSLSNGSRPFEWFESLTTNGLPGPIPAPCALRFPSGRTGPQPLRPPRACRMGPVCSNGSRASPRTDFPAPSRPRAPFDFPQDERGPNRSGHPELVEWAQPLEWFESLTTNGLPGPIPAPYALRFPSPRTS